jgi:thiol peroxidase
MARTVKMRGEPLELAGNELKVGDKAPNARLRKNLKEDFELKQTAGKTRIYSVVPSLDTPVCAAQTKRFMQEAATIPNVQIVTVSVDLPPAMSRFCAAEGLGDKVMLLSDYKDADFGQKYGTLIPSMRINTRAVFVVDKDDTVRYAEYVPEISEHPNYEAILKAARSA